MRPDIEEYLREQGWVFAGVSQPDHKRQWAQMDGDKVKRVALESELEDLALEIVGSPSGLDELAEKYSENILANSEDLQDAIADAYKAGWRDRGKSDEQQSAKWSDKDEEILDAMIDIVSNSLYEPLCSREGMLAWLKALRPSKTVLQRLNAREEKVNEAPDKIYLPNNPEVISTAYSNRIAGTDIEYIRKDTLLKWINEYKNYSSGPSWDLLKTHIESL